VWLWFVSIFYVIMTGFFVYEARESEYWRKQYDQEKRIAISLTEQQQKPCGMER